MSEFFLFLALLGMYSTVLLLTACIAPKGMIFTEVQNPEFRRKVYIETVQYYLRNTNFRIVFCENSCNDIDGEVIENRERFESLVFDGNDYDKSLGKGYGEFEIIRYAMTHSSFLREAHYIIKITGKLIIYNLNEILRHNKVLFGNRGDLIMTVFPSENVDTADSRCFLGSHWFFKDFCERVNEINDAQGYYFEHLLYVVIKENKTNGLVLNFPLPLVIEGYSWTSGQKYYSKELSSLGKLRCLRDYCKEISKRRNNGFLCYRSVFLLLVFSIAIFFVKIFRKLSIIGILERPKIERFNEE